MWANTERIIPKVNAWRGKPYSQSGAFIGQDGGGVKAAVVVGVVVVVFIYIYMLYIYFQPPNYHFIMTYGEVLIINIQGFDTYGKKRFCLQNNPLSYVTVHNAKERHGLRIL